MRFEDATRASRPSPMGTTLTARSVTPALAKERSRFSIIDSLPAARMSPIFPASPMSSNR